MGKSPDDLPLDPLSHQHDKFRDDGGDIRHTQWYALVAEIDELLDSEAYVWATDTLEGIKKTVEARRAVTEGQRKAVANIQAARSRQDGWSRRRYEGR